MVTRITINYLQICLSLSNEAHFIQNLNRMHFRKNWINPYDLDLNCSSKLEPASKLATGDCGKEARLLAQELRPVLTFLAARVNERHLRLSLFFFEWSAETERFWGSDWRNELREVGLLLLPLSKVQVILREIKVNFCCLCQKTPYLLFSDCPYIYLNLRRLLNLWTDRTIYVNLCKKMDNPTSNQPSHFGLFGKKPHRSHLD